MTKDTDPVTKADLIAFQSNVLEQFTVLRKDLADFRAEVDRQFHFVAEELSKLFSKVDEFEHDLEALCDHLETMVDHERRIRRLERRYGLVA